MIDETTHHSLTSNPAIFLRLKKYSFCLFRRCLFLIRWIPIYISLETTLFLLNSSSSTSVVVFRLSSKLSQNCYSAFLFNFFCSSKFLNFYCSAVINGLLLSSSLSFTSIFFLSSYSACLSRAAICSFSLFNFSQEYSPSWFLTFKYLVINSSSGMRLPFGRLVANLSIRRTKRFFNALYVLVF